MSNLFLKIINMSISASWLVLAVLLLRFVLKNAPKWINVLLWGIVAVRLACPFSIESALSLIPSAETISPGIMMENTPSVQTGIPAINSVINPVIGNSLAPVPGASANPLQIWIPILSIIWVVGVAALILYTAVSYWRLRRKVSEAVILRDNIFQSENVASPFVLGIIKPKVYLPYHMDGRDLNHVVAHEQAHIRRRDHWWKPLGFLLLTIHWFNPLMWLAYVLLCRDIELACDEKVIKELGNEQRADYTQALVTCSVNRRMIAACPLAFGEVGVKERVKSVMNYKKPAFWVIVLAVIVCVVVAVCFLTDPSDDNHAPEPFSHSYRVKKIMYQDTRYSFGYTMDTAPQYQLTSDYQLFVSGDAFDGSGVGEWVQHHGAFEEIKLSGLRFDDYFKDPGNLSGWDGARYGAESIREQTKQAWRLEVDDVENGVFYYLILTHTDKVFLCYGYNVGDTYAAAEEDSLIRWVFELERTDLLTCNAISEDCDAYIEPSYYPNGFDWKYDDLPVGTINKSGKLVFTANWDTDTLVVSEDYYRDYGSGTQIEKETYTLSRNNDGTFELDVSLRGDQSEEAFYFIQADTGVYVMKIILGTDEASLISDNNEEPALKYYLTIGAEGVKSIELSMTHSSGGFENADGSLLKKGECIWLESLDGCNDLRGLTITALGKDGEVIWTASVPNNDENKGFTHLTQDGWTISNLPSEDVALSRPSLNTEPYSAKGVSGLNVKELSRISGEFECQGGVSFVDLAPGEEIVSSSAITLEENSSVMLFITWGA